MNWLLLRQDSCWRMKRLMMAVVLGIFALTLGLVILTGMVKNQAPAVPWGGQSWSFVALLAMIWAALWFYLVSPVGRTRCNALTLAMPITVRRLWLTHLGAMLLTGTLMLAIVMGLIAIAVSFLGRVMVSEASLMWPGAPAMAARLAAGLVLGAVLLQRPHPTLQQIPFNSRYMLQALAVYLGMLVMMSFLVGRPGYGVMIPLGLAAWLAWRSSQRLPAGFLVIARTVVAEGPWRPAATRAGQWAAPAPRGRAWRLWSSLGQMLLGRWFLISGLAWLVVFCLATIVGGIYDAVSPGSGLHYAHILLTVYAMMAFAKLSVRNMHMLDPLPISRRAVGIIILLPNLLVASLGYGTGQLLARRAAESQERISYCEDTPDHFGVCLPAQYFEIAWDGEPPTIAGPRGETQEPWAVPALWDSPPLPGSRVRLHKPFTTSPESSPEFVAWQIQRAAIAVYGQAPSIAEIRKRYLRERPDGSVGIGESGLTLQADFPSLRSTERQTTFPLVFLLLGTLWLLAFSAYARVHRAGISDRRRTLVLVGILGSILGAHIAQFVLLMSGVTNLWTVNAFVDILMRHLTATLPGGALTIWVLSGLLVAGAYRLAEGQLARIEAPIVPARRGWQHFFPLLASMAGD